MCADALGSRASHARYDLQPKDLGAACVLSLGVKEMAKYDRIEPIRVLSIHFHLAWPSKTSARPLVSSLRAMYQERLLVGIFVLTSGSFWASSSHLWLSFEGFYEWDRYPHLLPTVKSIGSPWQHTYHFLIIWRDEQKIGFLLTGRTLCEILSLQDGAVSCILLSILSHCLGPPKNHRNVHYWLLFLNEMVSHLVSNPQYHFSFRQKIFPWPSL